MRKGSTKVIAILLVLLLTVGSILACAKPAPTPTPAEPERHRLTLSTSIPPSVFYLLGVKMADIITENVPNVFVAPVGLPGGAPGSVTNLAKKDIDLGMAGASQLYNALHGLGRFEGTPPPENVRHWFSLTRVYFLLFVLEDSEVWAPEDLAGMEFGSGYSGSATSTLVKATFESLGIDVNCIEKSLTDLISDVRDGRLVGLSKAGIGLAPPGTIVELDATKPMRMIGFTKEQMERSKKQDPLISWTLLPAGLFKGNEEMYIPYQDMGYLTRKGVPEDVIYEANKALMAHWDELVEVFPGLKGMDPPALLVAAVEALEVPLHPGSIKWLRELGYTVPESAIPPEMKR